MKTPSKQLVTLVAGVLCASLSLAANAADPAPLLGSPDYRPTAEHPVGWRGDWTGRFPGATPPLTWGRWPKGLLGLRCQARKPADKPAPTASTAALGLLPEWLVAGPFSVTNANAGLETEILAPEAALDPDAGEKAGEGAWKFQRPSVPGLNLESLLAKKDGAQVAYALTHIHAPDARKVNLTLNAGKAWLNGKALTIIPGKDKAPPSVQLELAAGWNRLLLKIATEKAKEWTLTTRLTYPAGDSDYETSNLAWAVKTPNNNYQRNAAMPVVIGERLYASVETMGLMAIERKDGRVAWLRCNTFADVIDAEERKAIADWAEKVQPELDKLRILEGALVKEINALMTGKPFAIGAMTPWSTAPLARLVKQRGELEASINKAITSALPRKRLNTYDRHDGGVAAPTPLSDGQHLFVWYANGAVLCLDLDGKRIWGKAINHGNGEHGNTSSPVLVGDLFIVQMAGQVVAFRTQDGGIAWESKTPSTHGSLVPLRIAGEAAVTTARGCIFRARDGQPIAAEGLYNAYGWTTPVIEPGLLIDFFSRGDCGGGFFRSYRLPAAAGAKLEMEKQVELPRGSLWDGWFDSSMLCYDGLAYAVNALGILRVLDLQTGTQVYEQQLDLHPAIQYVVTPGVTASPAIAGKRLYITDNQNTTVVLEPGRSYRPLASNTLHYDPDGTSGWGRPLGQEQTLSTPVFCGQDIYIVGGDFIYCVRGQ